ncbi:unnamed protein product [Leptosia nina]|uniref:Uncharacterized protein n=1 Tax=Leptosia nina TaxID=320188 RepID=A0AAV1JPH2_9NEOP
MNGIRYFLKRYRGTETKKAGRHFVVHRVGATKGRASDNASDCNWRAGRPPPAAERPPAPPPWALYINRKHFPQRQSTESDRVGWVEQ